MQVDKKLQRKFLAHLRKYCGDEFSPGAVLRNCAVDFVLGPMEFFHIFIYLLNPIVDGKEAHIIPTGPDTYRITYSSEECVWDSCAS